MLKLGKLSYAELAEKIRRDQNPVIVYGAGLIGQVVMPDVLHRLQLESYLRFYVDADAHKQGGYIHISGSDYEIRSKEELNAYCGRHQDVILLIANSNFYPIVRELDAVRELQDVETYLVPVLQIMESKNTVNMVPAKLTERQVIPKVIHYCWFSGREMPDELKRCMESWEKYCPDYEIKRWDESNYDVGKNSYMKDAYSHQKWSFVSDYARLDILCRHGGLYMDTDVELVRNLDELLYQTAFCGVEKWGNINTGGLSGAVAEHPMIRKMLEEREKASFLREDGSLNLETCGWYETRPFLREGMRIDNQVQTIGGVTVYSSDYFHPYDYMSGELAMTGNTFSIHHFNGGWLDERSKIQREKTRMQYHSFLRRMDDAQN